MTEPTSTRGLAFSCLCVTEDRPDFREWLLWNYRKQDHSHRELVVVDSSDPPLRWPDEAGLRVVRCDHGTPIPVKRNLAMRHAVGEAITWFDDDDWQHPRKLSLLAAALVGSTIAGNSRAWFVDLVSGRARRHVNRPHVPVFNSVGVGRAIAAAVSFQPERQRASDTPWLAAVRRRSGDRPAEVGEPLFFWLCHEHNLSNPVGSGRPFNHRVDAVRAAVGDADWGDTDEQLERLRARVGRPLAASRKTDSRPHTCVVITTYDRPESLGRLLDDIEEQWQGGGLSVLVFDDASTVDTAAIEARVRRSGWRYVRASRNHGKHGWWRWWNTILAELRRTTADRFVVLQDDVRLCDRFFERATEAWSRIADDRKASLFLHVDDYSVELGMARWTPFRERPAHGLVNCGWVDLTAFVCERRLFAALDWQLHPNAGRWGRDPLRGSGVGAQISTRLFAKGLAMYRTGESLILHTNTPSKMNAAARVRWPVRTLKFVDGQAAADRLAAARSPAFASLASVPGRERQLGMVVERLLPQVDRLGVYLNGYDRIPRFLADERIVVAESRSTGDRGDAGKFYWADQADGYVLTCDDDIDYPADYVAQLLDGIERHGRRAVVGFHGAVLHEPLVDYYRSRRLFHFSQALRRDSPVHVLGTGVCGYHASTWMVGATQFARPNMADIYFGLAAQEQQVPFICLRRETGWLRELPGTRSTSIYTRAQRSTSVGTSEQTQLARRDGGWRLHRVGEPVPLIHNAPRPPVQERLGAIVPVVVQGPRHRARLLLPQRDHITIAVQRSGTYYEADLLDNIRRLGVGGTYVDVGAHYGNHTLYFALECEADHVVAIEPNPVSLRSLISMTAENGVSDRVTALAIAIHPTCERVDLDPLPWRPRGTNGARTNSGMVGVRAADKLGHIRAQRLDDALAPFGRIAVLKIDAEDLSAEILLSGRSTLDRHRPVVAIEATSDEASARVAWLLQPKGYELVGRFCWTPTWLWVPKPSFRDNAAT